jgi:hypothetical protein
VPLDQRIVLASAGDWAAALLFVVLTLAWWGFLVWWISRYGARDVSTTFPSSEPPDEALRDWVDFYGVWLAGAGYRVVDQRPDRIAFVGHYRPRWEIAVAVLLFPFGLIALLGTQPAHLVVTATEGSVAVEGTLHRLMAKELEKDAAQGAVELAGSRVAPQADPG